jgi:hypothetical protein
VAHVPQAEPDEHEAQLLIHAVQVVYAPDEPAEPYHPVAHVPQTVPAQVAQLATQTVALQAPKMYPVRQVAHLFSPSAVAQFG